MLHEPFRIMSNGRNITGLKVNVDETMTNDVWVYGCYKHKNFGRCQSVRTSAREDRAELAV